MLEATVDEVVADHIVKGNITGGGHSLAQYNQGTSYSKIVRKVGTTTKKLYGADGKYEIMRYEVKHPNSNTPRIADMFPVEWSCDEIIAAVAKPDKLLAVMPDGKTGVDREVIVKNGVKILRIRDQTDRSVITAYPV
jgi:Bacterial EndoU nuclease